MENSALRLRPLSPPTQESVLEPAVEVAASSSRLNNVVTINASAASVQRTDQEVAQPSLRDAAEDARMPEVSDKLVTP